MGNWEALIKADLCIVKVRVSRARSNCLVLMLVSNWSFFVNLPRVGTSPKKARDIGRNQEKTIQIVPSSSLSLIKSPKWNRSTLSIVGYSGQSQGMRTYFGSAT